MEKNDAGLHSIVHKYKDMAKRFDTKKNWKHWLSNLAETE